MLSPSGFVLNFDVHFGTLITLGQSYHIQSFLIWKHFLTIFNKMYFHIYALVCISFLNWLLCYTFFTNLKTFYVTLHTDMWISRMLINCNSALSYTALYLCDRIKHKPTSYRNRGHGPLSKEKSNRLSEILLSYTNEQKIIKELCVHVIWEENS